MASRSPSLTRAVSAAIREAQLGPVDSGAAALARRYAALIEDAERISRELAEIQAEDDGQRQVLAGLRAAVHAQTVAADLGPKLLAALAALGLTPAARAAGKGGGAGGSAAGGGRDVLAELRAKRGKSG